MWLLIVASKFLFLLTHYNSCADQILRVLVRTGVSTKRGLVRCAEGMFSFVGSVEREYIATKQVYILAKFICSSFLSISLNFSAVSRGPSIDLFTSKIFFLSDSPDTDTDETIITLGFDLMYLSI